MKKETKGIGKKHIIIFLVGVLLLSGAVSYAYFTRITKTTGTGEVTTSTTVVNANTTLTTEGTLEFNDSDIYPGHKNISTIKVTATGKEEVDYNVIWTGTNSFTTTLNYYVYKTTTEETPSIICNKTTGLVDNMTTYYEVCTESGFDNLGSIVASGEIPTLNESTKIELIKGENIQATEEGNSVYYHVVIEYPNKEEGQNADFNKSINGEVGVEVKLGITIQELLAKKNIVEMPEITAISEEDTTGTVYSVEDDDGTSYVYRGAPTDNWVSFGGYYWRIIRVNGDGSVRLIYNGTSTVTTGTETQIGIEGSSSYNDNAYVGFMYGVASSSTYEATHTNTNDSVVKTQLDSWYSSSGLSNYAEYIDTNAGFCNDRQPVTGVYTNTNYGTLGYGTNWTTYAPYGRFYQNNAWKTTATPSLKCSQASNDLFTHISSNKGNKSLTKPIGLITSDEVIFAGCFGKVDNTSYYLYTGQYYWTMSPAEFNNGIAAMLGVNNYGFFSRLSTGSSYGVRPVINLRSDITLIGDGTLNSPYKIS